MGHPLRIGLFLSAKQQPIEVQRQVWRLADEGGFDHLWHDDHYLSVGGGSAADLPMLEGWTLLGAKAEVVRRARIGVLVTGTMFRHPGMLAKMAATVDQLSGGRVEVALGAGWNEQEFTMLGRAFPGRAERIERMDESCSVLKALWTQERANFDGTHYQLIDAICEPKPVQQPHPPIWIGGRGPLKTLRVAARHADVWNSSGGQGFDVDIESSQRLDEHCREIGRDPAQIRRSVQLDWTTADEVQARAERYVAAGFTELIIEATYDDPLASAEAALGLLPNLRALAAG
jgi:F420-dependent oxidoreductase-like protein